MKKQQNTPIYRLVIVGANGGIGRQCVEQALQAGHLVTAILRNPAKLAIEHPNLKKVSGDVMQPGTFENHFENQDAVVSAIGVAGGFGSDKPTTLYSQGNANVLKAMEQKGIKRIFLISASAIEISPVLPFYIRLIEKYIVQKLLKHMYTDLLKMEILIKNSNISWTIIRPPQLTNQAVTGVYRIAINAFLKNCLKYQGPMLRTLSSITLLIRILTRQQLKLDINTDPVDETENIEPRPNNSPQKE